MELKVIFLSFEDILPQLEFQLMNFLKSQKSQNFNHLIMDTIVILKDTKAKWRTAKISKFHENLLKLFGKWKFLKNPQFFVKTQGIFAKNQENVAKTQAVGKYFRNSRKVAEAPQNCSETQGIFCQNSRKIGWKSKNVCQNLRKCY